MITRKTATAFGVGLCVGLVAAGLFFQVCKIVAAKSTQVVTVTPVTDADMKEMFPETELYCLTYDGREFGLVTVEPGSGVTSVLIIDAKESKRLVSIYSEDGTFPGSISVNVCEGDIHSPVQTVVDRDADGIPERRMEWQTKTCFDLGDIQWVKTKQSETQPVTTQSGVLKLPPT